MMGYGYDLLIAAIGHCLSSMRPKEIYYSDEPMPDLLRHLIA
jgi:hypothetical protein